MEDLRRAHKRVSLCVVVLVCLHVYNDHREDMGVRLLSGREVVEVVRLLIHL